MGHVAGAVAVPDSAAVDLGQDCEELSLRTADGDVQGVGLGAQIARVARDLTSNLVHTFEATRGGTTVP